MAMGINTNVSSLNAQRNLGTSQSSLATSLQRLSSGLRINSAKDDAAGLAISDRMTSQINGLNQASRNANDGISLAQTAEGALQNVSDSLQRMRELSVQASNATNSASDRASLQNEVDQLVQQINTVASQTSFNGVKLLDGTFSSQSFQVGANKGETISINSIASARADTLGVGSISSYSTTLSSTVVTGALTSGGITVNGYNVGPSVSDGVSGSVGATGSADSAIAKAAAFNAVTSQTGVAATVTAASTTGTAITAVAAITAGQVKINGVDIGAVAAGGAGNFAEQGNNLTAAINAVSNQTGVTASFDTTSLKVSLNAADGRNITVDALASTTAGSLSIATGAAAQTATTYGGITLNSTNSAGITLGGADLSKAGLAAKAGANAATVTAGAGASSIDVKTAAGAQNAISTIDAALATVNSSRASLGAYQNRFTSAVANLSTSSENLSAARSRIRDTDFAAETAAMTRGQILQQAGTAMLAQANQLPQSVLSLLK